MSMQRSQEQRARNGTIPLRLQCPYCRAPMTPEQKTLEKNPFFPFCSERCKLADLHKWLSEEYAIEQPLETLTPEQWEDLPPPAAPGTEAAADE